jgi:hypothetical protein
LKPASTVTARAPKVAIDTTRSDVIGVLLFR